jgi:hypothetical protein
MSPTYVYLCQRCGTETHCPFKMSEYPQTIKCIACKEQAALKPSWAGPYGISGDNSASTSPKGKGSAGR